MNKNGEIILIDDDRDDLDVLLEAFKSLNPSNDIKLFDNGRTALEYLKSPKVRPFLVISDINMPIMDGFEIRQHIQRDNELKYKCIPYLFLSTSTAPSVVRQAYNLSVQGVFLKPNTFLELTGILQSILHYWSNCKAPNRDPVS